MPQSGRFRPTAEPDPGKEQPPITVHRELTARSGGRSGSGDSGGAPLSVLDTLNNGRGDAPGGTIRVHSEDIPPTDPSHSVSRAREHERLVMDAGDVQRALTRMVHEIVERNHGADGLVLVGIRTRGVPLAERLALAISRAERVPVPVAHLDVGLYRDDIADRPRLPVRPTTMPVDVAGRTVVLVDDVIYTGRTVRAALDAVSDLGRPVRIRFAALIDRGHRELPIRADFTGMTIPTQASERVQVQLVETDGVDSVTLRQLGG